MDYISLNSHYLLLTNGVWEKREGKTNSGLFILYIWKNIFVYSMGGNNFPDGLRDFS